MWKSLLVIITIIILFFISIQSIDGMINEREDLCKEFNMTHQHYLYEKMKCIGEDEVCLMTWSDNVDGYILYDCKDVRS